MPYLIVKASSAIELENKVIIHINKDGYVPIGGPVISGDANNYQATFYQALIKPQLIKKEV